MRRADLVPDCGNCAALCCVATAFDACEDFAIDKRAGEACPHLGDDCRCTIHDELVSRGFSGCAIYDCHGAGQRATREAADPTTAFLALRVIHELLWLLTEAAKLCPRDDLRAELAAEIAGLDAIAPARAHELDLAARTRAARALLRRVGDALLTRPGARADKNRIVVLTYER
jgi:hypothetical protein